MPAPVQDWATWPWAAPTDIALTNSSIAENATSLQVGLLQVTDDATVNPNFSFALLANGITNDHLAFSINDATGALSFNSQPDFETQASYTFDVRVTDEDGNSYTETLTVTVTDVSDTGTFWSDAMVADSATAGRHWMTMRVTVRPRLARHWR